MFFRMRQTSGKTNNERQGTEMSTQNTAGKWPRHHQAGLGLEQYFQLHVQFAGRVCTESLHVKLPDVQKWFANNIFKCADEETSNERVFQVDT